MYFLVYMTILDGKKLANKILDELKEEVKKLPASTRQSSLGGLPIKLAVVLVGSDPVSVNFVKQKQRAAEKIGVGFELYRFNENISEQKLIEEIKKIIKIKDNTGIVVQLPLPKHILQQKILNIIPMKKDVDALSVDNSFVEPPTASGIIRILNEYSIKIKGKKVVIIGRGKLVGKPLAKIIKKAGADLMTYDIRTKNLKPYTLKADILISATGCPCLIKKDMVKNKAIVIDVGFAKINNKIIGDVDFKNVKKKAKYITPVPGGVGPMTVAMLMNNLIKLAELNVNC